MKPFIKPTLALLVLCHSILFTKGQNNSNPVNVILSHGAIIRGDTTQKNISLVFTADEFGDGARLITNALKNRKIQGSFFFTGNFYFTKHTIFLFGKIRLYDFKMENF